MRVNNSKREDEKKKKKKKQSALEAEIFRIMEKSLDAALKKSLDNIFKSVGSIYKLEKMERKDDGYYWT